jgi:hypothetical protein
VGEAPTLARPTSVTPSRDANRDQRKLTYSLSGCPCIASDFDQYKEALGRQSLFAAYRRVL